MELHFNRDSNKEFARTPRYILNIYNKCTDEHEYNHYIHEPFPNHTSIQLFLGLQLLYLQDWIDQGFNIYLGQVTELWLFCYLVLLSIDSMWIMWTPKTYQHETTHNKNPVHILWNISHTSGLFY